MTVVIAKISNSKIDPTATLSILVSLDLNSLLNKPELLFYITIFDPLEKTERLIRSGLGSISTFRDRAMRSAILGSANGIVIFLKEKFINLTNSNGYPFK